MGMRRAPRCLPRCEADRAALHVPRALPPLRESAVRDELLDKVLPESIPPDKLCRKPQVKKPTLAKWFISQSNTFARKNASSETAS